MMLRMARLLKRAWIAVKRRVIETARSGAADVAELVEPMGIDWLELGLDSIGFSDSGHCCLRSLMKTAF